MGPTCPAGSCSRKAPAPSQASVRPNTKSGRVKPHGSGKSVNRSRRWHAPQRAATLDSGTVEARESAGLPQPPEEPTSLSMHDVGAADTAAAGADSVMVTFRFPGALEGQEVSVVGSFCDWAEPIVLRRSPETNDFVRSMALGPGTIQYKYIVDGTWTTSPCEPTSRDEQGQLNHLRLVAPSAEFRWQARWAEAAQEVFVTGDFAGWAELLPLRRDPATGDFSLPCSLPAGVYHVQFLVDGSWMTSPELPVGDDEDGHLCNTVSVLSPPAFHVCYATGWPRPTLHYRVLREDGVPHADDWQSLAMGDTASRASPAGGAWRAAVVAVPADLLRPALEASDATSSPEARTRSPTETAADGGGSRVQLEFYVSNGAGQEDRPHPGGAYRCVSPGGFKLQQGRLQPFPRARQAPSMLVSDLDGTMVGDGDWADTATQEFRDYWEANAALNDSVLVYNTGRSLGQFVSLLTEKAGKLALPDVLITAVGTKIFMLDCQSRSTANNAGWREDRQWARALDHGWNLGVAKQVVEETLRWLEEQGAGAWLDQGTEHPHRLALSVRLDRLHDTYHRLQHAFSDRGLQVRIIVSGVGQWRYVDCVAIRAGKLQALEYVRTLYGVPLDRCVAAGDSGNDILMLEGRNLALCVGNSQPALLSWLMEQPQTPRVIYTDEHMARGILEGLARHGLY